MFLNWSSVFPILIYNMWRVVQTRCIVIINREESTRIEHFTIPGAGVPVLKRGQISHIVRCIISSKVFFSTLDIDQTNWVYSNDQLGGDYQNCKFHYPYGTDSWIRVWPHKSCSEILFIYFFKNLHLYSWGMIQRNEVSSNVNQERVYRNCEFHDPWGWGFS